MFKLHNIHNVYEIYCAELCKAVFSDMRWGKNLGLINPSDFENRRVTRASAGRILNFKNIKSKLMENSCSHRAIKCYNFPQSNGLLHENIQEMTENIFQSFLRKFVRNYNYDSKDFMDMFS